MLHLAKPTIFTLSNVVKTLQVPAEVDKKYPELIVPLDEKVERQMADSINNAFAKINSHFHFDVREGDPTQQIIRFAKLKEIDLIVLGKKQQHIGRGITSHNVVNIGPCSALFVTANSQIEPKSILLPTDFSKASHYAYQKAAMIANHVNASITCLHTYEVPSGYYTIGKTYDEFAELMVAHSKEEFDEFIKKEEVEIPKLTTIYLLDKNGHPDKLIGSYASEHNFDLIVIGSKGRTALSAVLMGSVAARLVGLEIDVPILVVKGEEDNLKLIDAILQI